MKAGMLELGARPDTTRAGGAANVELRRLQPADWPAVEAIYREGIRGGLATFEVEPPTWEAWDAAHLPEHRLVAERGFAILGWAALAPVSARRAYRGVAENSIYVAEASRRQGIGGLLLRELLAGADRAGIWTVQTSIFPENRASVALHVRCGFRIVGVRERIGKRDGLWRDTFLLERRSKTID